MEFIEEYRGFEIFADLDSRQIIAFPVGAQCAEYVGEGLEDVEWQIDSFYFHNGG